MGTQSHTGMGHFKSISVLSTLFIVPLDYPIVSKAMKETWVREQERQARQLADERNNLAAEKAKLETLQKLKLEDNDTAKAEVNMLDTINYSRSCRTSLFIPCMC